MDIGTLEEQAASVRSVIAALDRPGGYSRDALAAAHHQAELLARRLVAAGEGTPALKKEIIGWVLRFRSERARTGPAPSAPGGGTGVRTKEPDAVQGRPVRGRPAPQPVRAAAKAPAPSCAPVPEDLPFVFSR
jgi:hypothetical protein